MRRSTSRPEPSSARGRSHTRRSASLSNSFGLSPARLRRRDFAAVLLGLPLLAAFATGVQAQVECTGDGPYEVPSDWTLKPSDIDGGTSFRLLFVTSTTRNATATNIATYNTYVQGRAKAGHSAITDSCGDQFKVLGSTSVNARDNTSTTGTGEAIYWLNSNNKVADNYADFYDGSWDSRLERDESGARASRSPDRVFTGSRSNGTREGGRQLGVNGFVRTGILGSGSPLNSSSRNASGLGKFYAISPIFMVEEPPKITSSTLVEAGSSLVLSVTNISSSWTTPITHSLTTTGTGTGHATLAGFSCSVEDDFGHSLDTYDVCDDEGTGYDLDKNEYVIWLRPSLDSVLDSGETFMVTLTDSSTSAKTVSFTMTINDPPPVLSVSLPTSEGERRSDAGEKEVPESEGTTGIGFDLSTHQPLSSALTVCVRVTESGGDRVASGNEGIKTVSLTSSGNTNGSGTHTLRWTNTPADDRDSSVTVEAVAPNTVGCSATDDSYTVSSSDASDKLLIQDDEDTTVELTSSDITMTEGDASDTATLTVELSRQLYAGETIGVPIALATTTGARLPGSMDNDNNANNDFTVSAAAGTGQSGVSLATNAPDTTPRVIFTGHDTNTVQTATVTLTPVANRDDGDATDETITATLTSLGLLETTVSGGVTAHSTNNAASLTLEDDEAAPARTPGITLSTAGPLRLLETGSTTYTVVLDAAPTADVRVPISQVAAGLSNGDQNAATRSPVELTFTTMNWNQPQTVMVTGSDESGTHRNRSLWLTHGVQSTDTRYGNLANTNLRVDVDDAPEVEAWDLALWDHTVLDKGDLDNPDPSKRRPLIVRVDRDSVERPSTVEATRGFRYFQNDMAPLAPLRYQLRLSNRPATGETVTVTATSSDFAKFGLSLTPGGTPRQSLTVTFEDRDADPVCFNGGHGTFYGGNTPSTAMSWACYRRIWVISTQNYATYRKGCADITHTASGGGLRSGAIGTIRVHAAAAGSHLAPSNAPGRDCPFITSELRGRSAPPALAAPAPTEAVANVQVTAVDDTSASVTWDAVEHATSYDVSWSAESSDALNASAGDLPGVTGTTATIDHGASVAMTLTVTVTPEYVDKNGVTQQLAGLAGTATLAVGPGSDALSASALSADSQTPACVSDALRADVQDYAGETWRTSPGHVERWSRVLAAFGDSNGYSNNPMTVAEAQAQADRGLQRWVPVAAALECLANPPQEEEEEEEEEEAQPATLASPELSLSAGSAVDEGGNAGFTVTADPAPQSDLTIAYTVAQSGDYLAAPGTGSRPTTLAAGATSLTLSVATVDDSANEADGSVSISLGTGTGYTVATGKANATVTVQDNDEPVVSIAAGSGVTEGTAASFTVTASPTPATPLDVTLTIDQSGDVAAADGTGERTVTIPVTGSLTVEVTTVDDAVTESDGAITATVTAGTGYMVVAAPDNAATVAVSDNDAAAAAPTFSIGDETANENGGMMYFTVRLNRAVQRTVKVTVMARESTPVSARHGEDWYWWWPDGIVLTFYPGQTEKKTQVYVYNDSHDEDPETFEVVLTNPTNGAVIGDGVGMGTIVNSDPIPAAWLGRFGRTVSHQVVEGIQGRFTATTQAGLTLTVAGEELTSATPLAENQQVLAKVLGFETVTAQQAVEGSAFSFAPAGEAGSPARFAIWGQGALSSFSGAEDNVSLDGDVTTALLGAEWSGARWLAGAALSHSWGSGGYAKDNTDTTEDTIVADGDITTTLTGIFPYGRYRLTPRLGIWATAGYGWGDLTLKPDGDGTDYSPGITMTMGAVGMDGLLRDGGAEGLSLTSTADALLVKTTSDAVTGLASSEANISRLRLGLEATRPVPLANGASLLPSLELGIRQDSGDAETGFGMELGAGLTWADSERGISAALKGRTLLTHADEEFREQGLAVSFAWEPNPSNRGPSLALSHAVGAVAEGGMDALLSPTTMELLDATPSRHHQFETKLAYGFPAFNDRLTLTPGVGLALSPDSRTYSLLWALAPYAQQSQAEPWEISLEGERQEGNTAESAVEHSLKLRFSVPF